MTSYNPNRMKTHNRMRTTVWNCECLTLIISSLSSDWYCVCSTTTDWCESSEKAKLWPVALGKDQGFLAFLSGLTDLRWAWLITQFLCHDFNSKSNLLKSAGLTLNDLLLPMMGFVQRSQSNPNWVELCYNTWRKEFAAVVIVVVVGPVNGPNLCLVLLTKCRSSLR